MATARIPILGAHTTPDNTGLVWFEPQQIIAGGAFFDHLTVIFDNPGSTQNKLYFAFEVPQNYSSAPVFSIMWSNVGTTGNAIEIDVEYRCVALTESADQATAQETLNTADTNSTTSDILQEVTLAATAGNFAAKDICMGFVARDGSDAGDTLADEIHVHQILFEYTTT